MCTEICLYKWMNSLSVALRPNARHMTWSFFRFRYHTQRRTTLLWTSDQPVAETSTWQHTALTTDRYSCLRWDSNPPYQKASGHSPTAQTARPLGPANKLIVLRKIPACIGEEAPNINPNLQNTWLKSLCINPLNTKRRLFYLKTQFAPRSKHFSSRL